MGSNHSILDLSRFLLPFSPPHFLPRFLPPTPPCHPRLTCDGVLAILKCYHGDGLYRNLGVMSRGILPPKAQVDALHIACVAHHRIQYLLTWNCKHIANARILPRIYSVLNDFKIPIPIICTPEELLGDDTDIED